MFVMSKINYILYKHISEKYSSVPAFAEISGIPQKELDAVLLKDDIIQDVYLGLEICDFLDLDIEKLLVHDEILVRLEAEANAASREQSLLEFRRRYRMLSEVEKKQVRDYMNSLK